MPSIFTQIINGSIPGNFIWKDEIAVAILTIQPIRTGHALVIPREEIDHWDDLSPETAAHLMQVAQKIAKGLKCAFPSKRVGMIIAGLEVPHTHLHVYPIDTMGELDFRLARNASPDTLAETAETLRTALNDLGYPNATP